MQISENEAKFQSAYQEFWNENRTRPLHAQNQLCNTRIKNGETTNPIKIAKENKFSERFKLNIQDD